MCANHSKILGGKTETCREKEWKDKAVVTIGDVFQLKQDQKSNIYDSILQWLQTENGLMMTHWLTLIPPI